MSMKRLIAAALLFMLVGSASDANAQRLFLQGGALVAEESELSSSLTGTLPAISGGVQFDYASFGRVRAGLTYQDLLSLEAAIQLHPLGVDATVNPYIFAGYGRYFSRGVNDEKGMIPLGIGP